MLNLSILEKLKVCMFSNIAFLRFLAKPAEALAPNTPPRYPEIKPAIARTTIIHAVL